MPDDDLSGLSRRSNGMFIQHLSRSLDFRKGHLYHGQQ